MNSRSPAAVRACSTQYSTPLRRGSTQRGGRSGWCASTSQTSLVSRQTVTISMTSPDAAARSRCRTARRAPRTRARRRPAACRPGAARPGTAGTSRRAPCRRTSTSRHSRRRCSRCAAARRAGLAGLEVAEAQPVDLVAGRVDGVREQPLVGADEGDAEVEVARAAGQRGRVEQITVASGESRSTLVTPVWPRAASRSGMRQCCAYSPPSGIRVKYAKRSRRWATVMSVGRERVPTSRRTGVGFVDVGGRRSVVVRPLGGEVRDDLGASVSRSQA